MKASNILPSYISGVATHKGTSFFTMMKENQHLSSEDKAESLHLWNKQVNASNKRQREIKRRFPNSKVLYV